MRTYFFSRPSLCPIDGRMQLISIQTMIERLSLTMSSSWLNRSPSRRVLLAMGELGHRCSMVFIHISKSLVLNLSFISIGKRARLHFSNKPNIEFPAEKSTSQESNETHRNTHLYVLTVRNYIMGKRLH